MARNGRPGRSLLGVALFLCFATLLQGGAARAQFTAPASGVAVYLVTTGPGAGLFARFGHAGLVVSTQSGAWWYDYGAISPGLQAVGEYLTGSVQARVVKLAGASRIIDRFAAEDRAIRVQRLTLPPERLGWLAARLEADAASHISYPYRHLGDNCSTRIRDLIDEASGGSLRSAAVGADGRVSVREASHRAGSPPGLLLMDLTIGPRADHVLPLWEAALLPSELAHLVERAGQRYSIATEEWTRPRRQPPPDPVTWKWHVQLFLLGILLSAPVAVLSRMAARRPRSRLPRVALATLATLLLGSIGVAGAVVASSLLGSIDAVESNQNVLLLNPLLLGTLPYWLSAPLPGRATTRSRLATFCMAAGLASAGLAVGLHAVPGYRQDNWLVIALVLPALIGAALALEFQIRSRGRGEDAATGYSPPALGEFSPVADPGQIAR